MMMCVLIFVTWRFIIVDDGTEANRGDTLRDLIKERNLEQEWKLRGVVPMIWVLSRHGHVLGRNFMIVLWTATWESQTDFLKVRRLMS